MCGRVNGRAHTSHSNGKKCSVCPETQKALMAITVFLGLFVNLYAIRASSNAFKNGNSVILIEFVQVPN